MLKCGMRYPNFSELCCEALNEIICEGKWHWETMTVKLKCTVKENPEMKNSVDGMREAVRKVVMEK